ncbi:MAG TPA: DUF3151 family protein [Acidimicrobiales bacterium]|nr:DUF3151 family protein [Acidimicrobiales bacterium]
MSDPSPVSLTGAAPETVLPDPEPDAVAALDAAAQEASAEPARAYRALAAVAARFPTYLEAWAALAEHAADDPVASYAFARVAYHRGLDALRRAGWRGSGYVRWQAPSNRGFLRGLDALRRAAGALGESDEEERCALFLRQLDPGWERR